MCLLAGHANDRLVAARAVLDNQPFIPIYPRIAPDGGIIYTATRPEMVEDDETDGTSEEDPYSDSDSDSDDESEMDDASDSGSSKTDRRASPIGLRFIVG